jgi:hypothetical protein
VRLKIPAFNVACSMLDSVNKALMPIPDSFRTQEIAALAVSQLLPKLARCVGIRDCTSPKWRRENDAVFLFAPLCQWGGSWQFPYQSRHSAYWDFLPVLLAGVKVDAKNQQQRRTFATDP